MQDMLLIKVDELTTQAESQQKVIDKLTFQIVEINNRLDKVQPTLSSYKSKKIFFKLTIFVIHFSRLLFLFLAKIASRSNLLNIKHNILKN